MVEPDTLTRSSNKTELIILLTILHRNMVIVQKVD